MRNTTTLRMQAMRAAWTIWRICRVAWTSLARFNALRWNDRVEPGTDKAWTISPAGKPVAPRAMNTRNSSQPNLNSPPLHHTATPVLAGLHDGNIRFPWPDAS